MKKKLHLIIVFVVIGMNQQIMASGPVVPPWFQSNGPDAPPSGSQDGPDAPPSGSQDGPDAPPASPINDYIPLLILAGGILGFKKLRKKLN